MSLSIHVDDALVLEDVLVVLDPDDSRGRHLCSFGSDYGWRTRPRVSAVSGPDCGSTTGASGVSLRPLRTGRNNRFPVDREARRDVGRGCLLKGLLEAGDPLLGGEFSV